MPTKLGQNFLTNESIAKKIVDSADLSKTDNVLEIGPGKGVLTKYLAEKAGEILAVEIDKNLAILLKTKLILSNKSCRNKCDNEKNYKNIEVIEGDILKINLPRLIGENNFEDYKVVANLPYYITSKIIRLFLETKYPPSVMILMVQKEVGERIIARGGKESILSISVKFYADPEILCEVPRENFVPVPEVDSVVIRLKRKEKIPEADIKNFFSLVRGGFSAKRKMLANNLSAGLSVSKEAVLETLKKAGLKPTVRAEKLSVEDWVKLYRNFIPG
jgi:16S rRNA (adenine1518-N6/adenine1519-N6)-dimethyltransferase